MSRTGPQGHTEGAVYAVYEGRQRGIFGTWKEARAQIQGYPGAIYKKLHSRAEAEAWLQEYQQRSVFAVHKGRKRGIFATWPEALKQVKDYPQAVYKKLGSREAAQAWLDGYGRRDGAASVGVQVDPGMFPDANQENCQADGLSAGPSVNREELATSISTAANQSPGLVRSAAGERMRRSL